MAAAQEAYEAMMREAIRPRLRALGFRGSGSAFVWPVPGVVVQVGFQKSQFSDRNDLRFTLNLSVIGESEWEDARRERAYLPNRPAANTRYGVGWGDRVGTLLPDGEDHWWILDATADWGPVAEEVLQVIEHMVLPALQQRTDR